MDDHQAHIMAQVNAAIERQNSFQKHLVKQRELAVKGEVAVTVFKNTLPILNTNTSLYQILKATEPLVNGELNKDSFTTLQEERPVTANEDPAEEGEDYSPKRMLMPREHYQYLKRDSVIMKRAMSTPSLAHLSKSRSRVSLKDSSTFGLIRRNRPREEHEQNDGLTRPSTAKKMRVQRQYQSAPNVNLDTHHTPVEHITGPASACCASVGKENMLPQRSPREHLRNMIEKQGRINIYKALEQENFFHEVTPEQIAAYDKQVIDAVRSEDVDELRKMAKIEGRNLRCCNKFGESILHMACRRGSTEVVKFLLCEAGVSTRVRDDYGRTPLHDACWTREPQFELVSLIIESCPELLSVSDKRGHTPLSYVRRDHWDAWIKFLDEHPQMVIPKELS